MPTKTTTTPMTTPLTTTTPHPSHAMPTTTTPRRRPTPTTEITPMPNTMPTASLPSAPANDITASPPCGPALRRTAMPLARAVSSPTSLLTSENTMQAALALDTVKPTLTLVHSVPVPSNAATSRRAPRPLAPPEAAALRASQVNQVAAEEIAFFFTCDSDDEASVQALAVIAGLIARLAPSDQQALALYYEPEPWPESILEEGLDFANGYALVLSRASAAVWRRNGRRRYAAEQTSNEQLRAAVLERGPRALRHLTRRAEWDFAAALRAYANTRGRAPSVLSGQGRASGASEES